MRISWTTYLRSSLLSVGGRFTRPLSLWWTSQGSLLLSHVIRRLLECLEGGRRRSGFAARMPALLVAAVKPAITDGVGSFVTKLITLGKPAGCHQLPTDRGILCQMTPKSLTNYKARGGTTAGYGDARPSRGRTDGSQISKLLAATVSSHSIKILATTMRASLSITPSPSTTSSTRSWRTGWTTRTWTRKRSKGSATDFSTASISAAKGTITGTKARA